MGIIYDVGEYIPNTLYLFIPVFLCGDLDKWCVFMVHYFEEIHLSQSFRHSFYNR